MITVGNNTSALCIGGNDGGNDGFAQIIIYLIDDIESQYCSHCKLKQAELAAVFLCQLPFL